MQSEREITTGKGPRHLVFHQTLKTAYLVNELDSTVSVFNVNVNDEWMEQSAVGERTTEENIRRRERYERRKRRNSRVERLPVHFDVTGRFERTKSIHG